MRPRRLSALLALGACIQRDLVPARVDSAASAPSDTALVALLPPADARTLRFRLGAPAGQPLHLENCNGALSWGLERRVAGAWTPAWTVATDACHSAPLVIPSGGSRDFTEAVTLQAGERLPADTYRIVIHGLYRTHAGDHAAGDEVPHARRVSPPLTLGPLPAP